MGELESQDYEKNISFRLSSINPEILVNRISQETYELHTSNFVGKSVVERTGHMKVLELIRQSVFLNVRSPVNRRNTTNQRLILYGQFIPLHVCQLEAH